MAVKAGEVTVNNPVDNIDAQNNLIFKENNFITVHNSCGRGKKYVEKGATKQDKATNKYETLTEILAVIK